MKVTRVSILGSGLVLLQLMACSATEQAHKQSASDERIDIQPGGTTTDLTRSGDVEPPPVECDYKEGQDIDTSKLKWRNTLPRPRWYAPITPGGSDYEITVRAKDVQMLPDCYPKTHVFAYGGRTLAAGETVAKEEFSSPGPTFEMTRGEKVHVTWKNDIEGDHLFAVDPTLHWANPRGKETDPPATGPFPAAPNFDPKWQSPVPIVTHVHGLEVASDSDGAPSAWFTPGWAKTGPDFRNKTYEYPNSQPATTLWYHDHTLGITRINVYAGLAGMYIIRDAADEAVAKLPDRDHEMPLVIQDKSFDTKGQLVYPASTFEGAPHPYWNSFFFGETIVVNGKIWPKMQVDRTRYRFRVLNAANSRPFSLTLSDQFPITVIGSDGGYLPVPKKTSVLTLAPGERADVVIDFSALLPGTNITMTSEGGDIVQFEAKATATVAVDPTCSLTAKEGGGETKPALCFPNGLNPNKTELEQGIKRTVTLIENPADSTPLLNGQTYHSEVTETPKLGTTEDWDIVNTMGGDHPMHLHLVQFKLLERRKITGDYLTQWTKDNGTNLPLHGAAKNPAVDTYLTPDPALDVPPADTGWKDTIVVPGNSVTRIRVRWAPQDNTPFPFDATALPGYVWHCHILEHEDNEMMRPLQIK